jgi:hypothetical protein
MDDPIRMDLYLKTFQTGGVENIHNILKYMHTTKYKFLQDVDEKITISYTENNDKNYFEHYEKKRDRNDRQDVQDTQNVISQYYAYGTNTVVFDIKINNEEETKILKIIEIDSSIEAEYLKNYVKKYKADKSILSHKNITHVFYYGLINKHVGFENFGKKYFYIITKKYKTDFENLELRNKIKFIYSLLIILKELHTNNVYLKDLKLINLGYEEIFSGIKCIIIDYDINTFQWYYVNNRINIYTHFRGNTFFPNYAIEFVKNLDNKCIEDNYYLMGSKYDKMDVLGLVDVILILFFDEIKQIIIIGNNTQYKPINSQLRCLNKQGSYINNNGDKIQLTYKAYETKATDFYYENMWLKDKIRLERFVNVMLIPLQDSYMVNTTIKNLLYSDKKCLLAPEYNNILSYQEIINVWHTMYENLDTDRNITITYENYINYPVKTVSPDYENRENYTNNIETGSPVGKLSFGGKKYVLRRNKNTQK